jgi:hypothetical protein
MLALINATGATMAKTGKRRSKSAPPAKRLRAKAQPQEQPQEQPPSKLIAELREFEAQRQAYWAKVSEGGRRELDRAMGDELGRAARREVQAPQPTTTIGAMVLEARGKLSRGKHEGPTAYARRLQAIDSRLAREKLGTIVRRLYDK